MADGTPLPCIENNRILPDAAFTRSVETRYKIIAKTFLNGIGELLVFNCCSGNIGRSPVGSTGSSVKRQ